MGEVGVGGKGKGRGRVGEKGEDGVEWKGRGRGGREGERSRWEGRQDGMGGKGRESKREKRGKERVKWHTQENGTLKAKISPQTPAPHC